MIAVYILLGILALLSVLLIPVFLSVRYETGKEISIYIRVLFFLKLDLAEMAKKREKKPGQEENKPKKQKKPKKEKPKAQKSPKEFSEQLGMVVDLLSSVKGGAGILIRNFRLYKIYLHLVVAREDAAQTAISYGKCNAAVYTAYALAENFLNMARPEIAIEPDFVTGESLVVFRVKGRLIPIVAVWAALKTAAGFLKRTMKRKSREKQAQRLSEEQKQKA